MNSVTEIQIEQKQLEITCTDKQIISATLFQGLGTPLQGAVMIAPATGIKQTFYSTFASWLAQHGYCTITFDNRGIGASLSKDVKNSPASLQDWGELDMPAVLDELVKQIPNTKYHLIGHSAGGQLTGLMPNASLLSSMFNFASSSGNLSKMKLPFRLQAHFFMNFFIPLSNLIFGYTKSHWVGMGEPLPKAAGKQWSRWCNGEGYLKTDFGQSITQHYYDSLQLPALWLHALDDDIANYANVMEMKNVYTGDNSKIISLDPDTSGKKQIGHMGYFRESCNDLWPMALEWFEKH